jgi:hypothetical protein
LLSRTVRNHPREHVLLLQRVPLHLGLQALHRQ